MSVYLIISCQDSFDRSRGRWDLGGSYSHTSRLAFLGTVLQTQCFVPTHILPSNVLGGNFSRVGVPSLGASGAIFGTIAVSSSRSISFSILELIMKKVTWVDLFAHWKYHYRPVRKVFLMHLSDAISIHMLSCSANLYDDRIADWNRGGLHSL